MQLTSESIDTHIRKLLREGQLRDWLPRLRPHEACKRRLLVTPPVGDWIERRGKDEDEREFYANVRAFLKSFIIGEDFDDIVKLKPMKVDQGGIWSLRITWHPQHRILGGFLVPGVFVATVYRDRRQIGENFVPHLARARNIWCKLFPHWPPVTGTSRADLLEFCHEEI